MKKKRKPFIHNKHFIHAAVLSGIAAFSCSTFFDVFREISILSHYIVYSESYAFIHTAHTFISSHFGSSCSEVTPRCRSPPPSFDSQPKNRTGEVKNENSMEVSDGFGH